MTAQREPEPPARPPRTAESFLAWLLPREDRGPIIGDVAEEFAARVHADGVRAARRWYWRHAVQSSLPAANRRWRHWQGSGRSQRGQIMAKLGSLWLDVKLGLRMLVKFPGLTAVALLALALGIPAGVAPTHFANAWQAPPPLEEGERLQVLRNVDVDLGVVRPTALYDFIQWREALTSYSAIGAAIDGVYNVSDGDGVTTPVEGAEVTSAVFDALRVGPLMGRTLTAADDELGAPQVVVIGHDVWEARFASDPDVVGRVIDVGGIQRTVVGVMPEDFRYP